MTHKYLLPLLFCTILLLVTGEKSLADEPSGFDTQIIKFELKQHKKLLAKITSTSVLSPFSTDGCSGGLSVGWQYMAAKIPAFKTVHGTLPPWESCCITHDHAYHSGPVPGDSSRMSFSRRKDADKQLQTCVLATGKRRSKKLLAEYDVTEKQLDTIYQQIAELMYKAVRLGGIPCSGLPWRWGYGWPSCM